MKKDTLLNESEASTIAKTKTLSGSWPGLTIAAFGVYLFLVVEFLACRSLTFNMICSKGYILAWRLELRKFS